MIKDASPFQQGLRLLHHPVLPLVRIIQMLYLTGPFESVAPILDELTEPIETNNAVYNDPAALLRPHLPVLQEFEHLKRPPPQSLRRIVDEQLEPVDPFEALELWVAQKILVNELEEINSLLCHPCGCTLCCTGPEASLSQEFFEIPLAASEIKAFTLPAHDTAATRQGCALDEPSLTIGDRPFYKSGPALFHWRTGWSLILPRASACPHLDGESGGCLIYPLRPDVCRRPQIFAYVLERQPDLDREEEGEKLPVYVRRNKLLAVWDCPYVRRFKQEIAAYAEVCGLEPVFKTNKA